MKKIVLASVAATGTLFGMNAASAQGLPGGTVPPQYGSQAWSGHRHEATSQIGLPAKSPTASAKAAEQKALSRPSGQTEG
jgi:hypothetical protein